MGLEWARSGGTERAREREKDEDWVARLLKLEDAAAAAAAGPLGAQSDVAGVRENFLECARWKVRRKKKKRRTKIETRLYADTCLLVRPNRELAAAAQRGKDASLANFRQQPLLASALLQYMHTGWLAGFY